MVELTLQVSNSLAQKIQSFGVWSDTILELSLEDFKSSSVQSARQNLIKFLSKNPDASEVSTYFVAPQNQQRLDYLLDLNGESEIDEQQVEELREWRKFNQISTTLKIKAAKRSK
jgi:hypothetical protein